MSTKRKPAVKYEDVVLFPHPFQVCLVTSEEEFDQVLKDWKVRGERPDWLMSGAYGQVHVMEKGDDLLLVVSLKAKNKDIASVAGILAHEATHCTQKIMHHMCEWTPSKELEAYSNQMITLTLMNQYQKKRGR
jgi:hypothetical protein